MKKVLKFIFLDLALLLSVYEIFIENEWVDKADDIIFAGLAIGAIILPKLIKKSLPRYFSLIILSLALAVKIAAYFIENDDAKAIGLDYAIILLMALGIAINFWMNKRK